MSYWHYFSYVSWGKQIYQGYSKQGKTSRFVPHCLNNCYVAKKFSKSEFYWY